MATGTEDRLGDVRNRIERLEAKAQASAAEVRSRMRPYLDTLEEDAESARAAARARAAAGEASLAQLDTELKIAEHRLTVEAAEDRIEFLGAVEAVLDSWDAYLERAQASVSNASDEERERAESAIADLRQRRLAVAKSLSDVRANAVAAWRDTRSSALAGLDELKRTADAAFRTRGEDFGT